MLGYRLYEATRDPLSLGLLGLAEALPNLALALLGGHFADRADRRLILVWTRGVIALCAALFLVVPASGAAGLASLYALAFVAGLARGFGGPAVPALEAHIVPGHAYVNAAAWMSSANQACLILGPALGGVVLGALGERGAFGFAALLAALAWGAAWTLRPAPVPPAPDAGGTGAREGVLQSVREGMAFVRRDPAILGSMALDLFAVLFGGVVALLPVFARDFLKVGPQGLGLLLSAPAVGALLVTLWATRRPPGRFAGRLLLLCVAGFGVSVIVFALSRNFLLSLVALFLSGVFDGVSIVVRRAIVRLRTPDRLRGRVAAVSLLFIGASNELGALESGVAARLVGTVPAVWGGGLVTLLVVALTAWRAPELRRLHLDAPGPSPADHPPPTKLGP